jgi:uncharacterized glyoxalase superfamily protein PhnB
MPNQDFIAQALSASLTVKDIHASQAWYRDVLGFAVDEEYKNEDKLMGVGMKAGEVFIMLGQDDGAKGWDRVKGQGMSFYITTEQDIDELASRIKAAGGTLETEPADMPWGARIFRLHDPDGFKLTISSTM